MSHAAQIVNERHITADYQPSALENMIPLPRGSPRLLMWCASLPESRCIAHLLCFRQGRGHDCQTEKRADHIAGPVRLSMTSLTVSGGFGTRTEPAGQREKVKGESGSQESQQGWKKTARVHAVSTAAALPIGTRPRTGRTLPFKNALQVPRSLQRPRRPPPLPHQSLLRPLPAESPPARRDSETLRRTG